MLTFIGLGLSEKGITLQGLEEAKKAKKVYAEFYTNKIPNFCKKRLEKTIGKKIHELNRQDIEENPDKILKESKEKKIALLIPGDPMIATTHIDLRLRAKKRKIKTKIIHSQSIETAAPGMTGLQSYKFGKTATIPLDKEKLQTPIRVLKNNKKNKLHTLFLLDIKAKEKKFLKANKAIEYLLKAKNNQIKNFYDENSLSIVIARAGNPNSVVKGDRAKKLMKEDFGKPPHSLIIPGELHFLEKKALKKFAKVPQKVIDMHD